MAEMAATARTALDTREAGGALAGAMSEHELQEAVRALCRTCGFWHYHTYRSTRSESGFVDSVIVRDPARWPAPWLFLVELKREHGRLTPWQRAWGDVLRRCEAASGRGANGVGPLRYLIVRPSSWPALARELAHGARE